MDGETAYPTEATKTEVSPESMPEIHREMTILRGAFEGLRHRTEELIDKTSYVTREPVPELGNEVMKAVGPDSLPVATPLGKEMRDLSREMNLLEDRVIARVHRVEL